MKWPVEAIGILVLQDVLLEEEWEAHKMRFSSPPCRARRVPIDTPYRCF